ncbi:MAG: AgmX/PglI C-terminal domain-containing protein [Myxococcales bacterium]|nr:AgmX/PglI C-terminal domain-containing protein [Myxococcales bacterium]
MQSINVAKFVGLTAALAGLGPTACGGGARTPEMASAAPVAVIDVPDASAAAEETEADAIEISPLGPADEGADEGAKLSSHDDGPSAEDPPIRSPSALSRLSALDGGAFGGVLGLGSGAGLAGSGLGQSGGGLTGAGMGHAPTRAKMGTVTSGPAAVHGGLPSEIIERIVRQRLARIRYCHLVALRSNPKFSTRVATRFVIAADGGVKSTAIIRSSGVKGFDACVLNSLNTLSFPKPTGGGDVVVSYPFVFSANP